MYIVAPESDSDRVRKEMTRSTFEAVLSPVAHSSLQFLNFKASGTRMKQLNAQGHYKKSLNSILVGGFPTIGLRWRL